MGTRSLTFIYDDSNTPVLNMYRQYDGYPSCHGLELAEFISKKTIINGISNQKMDTHANGMTCLAAQIVCNFKDDIGGIYLESPSSTDFGQDYSYHVYQDKVVVKKYNNEEIFSGSWKEFLAFCNSAE